MISLQAFCCQNKEILNIKFSKLSELSRIWAIWIMKRIAYSPDLLEIRSWSILVSYRVANRKLDCIEAAMLSCDSDLFTKVFNLYYNILTQVDAPCTNPCAGSPCQNGGWCRVLPNKPTQFICECNNYYDGVLCQNCKWSPIISLFIFSRVVTSRINPPRNVCICERTLFIIYI